MKPQKPFKLNRGCSLVLVLAWALMIVIGVLGFRLLQLPNELGTGLGRAGRLMNVLVSTDAGHRQMLAVYDDGHANLEFLDKAGLYDRFAIVSMSDNEWHVLSAAYQQWCTHLPQKVEQGASRIYDIGISCSDAFGHHIQVQETQLPAEMRLLFNRVVTK
jgi:hypothetical protein